MIRVILKSNGQSDGKVLPNRVLWWKSATNVRIESGMLEVLDEAQDGHSFDHKRLAIIPVSNVLCVELGEASRETWLP